MASQSCGWKPSLLDIPARQISSNKERPESHWNQVLLLKQNNKRKINKSPFQWIWDFTGDISLRLAILFLFYLSLANSRDSTAKKNTCIQWKSTRESSLLKWSLKGRRLQVNSVSCYFRSDKTNICFCQQPHLFGPSYHHQGKLQISALFSKALLTSVTGRKENKRLTSSQGSHSTTPATCSPGTSSASAASVLLCGWCLTHPKRSSPKLSFLEQRDLAS